MELIDWRSRCHDYYAGVMLGARRSLSMEGYFVECFKGEKLTEEKTMSCKSCCECDKCCEKCCDCEKCHKPKRPEPKFSAGGGACVLLKDSRIGFVIARSWDDCWVYTVDTIDESFIRCSIVLVKESYLRGVTLSSGGCLLTTRADMGRLFNK